MAEYGVGLNAGLKGEKGLELRQHWQDIGGPKAYRGTAVPGVSTKGANEMLIP